MSHARIRQNAAGNVPGQMYGDAKRRGERGYVLHLVVADAQAVNARGRFQDARAGPLGCGRSR